MHPTSPQETTAISDDLVLESLGYTPGTVQLHSIIEFMDKVTEIRQSSSVYSLCLA
jgi:hypothetical protein